MQTLKPKAQVDGRFEVLEFVGAGGMGMVYKARQIDLDRTVALKFLLPNLSDEQEALARFKIEAEALAALKHRNINLFYAYGIWHGRAPYIAIEYLEAPNLAQVIANNRGRLSWRRTLKIAAQLCDALAHAHKHGIIHRDLKPSNIFVVNDDKVKVTDFGLAKIIDDAGSAHQKLTATGCTVGSPMYMSPEQALGEKVTAASDMYAVGCIMYECLFSRPPFSGDNPVNLLYQHANVECSFPDPRLDSELPQGVMSCLKTGLEKNPADRFESMQAMGAAIDEILTRTEELPDTESTFLGGKMLSPEPGKSERTAIDSRIKIITAASLAVALILLALNIQPLMLLKYDMQMHFATGAFDKSNVELKRIEIYHQMHADNAEQIALTNYSHLLEHALKSAQFKKLSGEQQRLFLHSAIVALMRWKPAQPKDADHLSYAGTEARKFFAEEADMIDLIGLSLSRPFQYLPQDYVKISLSHGVRLLRRGLHSPYRELALSVYQKSVQRTNASLSEMESLASDVDDSCKKHQLRKAIEFALPIYQTYCATNQTRDAQKLLERVTFRIDAAADNPYAFNVLSHFYRALAFYHSRVGSDEDIAFYQRAIRNEERRVPETDRTTLSNWLLILGDAQRMRGNNALALAAYRKAIPLDKEAYAAQGYISWIGACCQIQEADILASEGEYWPAEELYNHVANLNLAEDPVKSVHIAIAGNSRLEMDTRRRGVDKSFTSFQRDNYASLIYVGQMYCLIGRPDLALEAIKPAEKLIKDDVQRRSYAINQARIYRKKGDENQSLHCYATALSVPQTDVFAIELTDEYARAMLFFNHPEQAKQLWKECESRLPNPIPQTNDFYRAAREVYLDLAWFCESEQNTAGAIAYMQKALQLDRSHHRTRAEGSPNEGLDEGIVALLENKLAEAEDCFRTTLALYDDSHEEFYALNMYELSKVLKRQSDDAGSKRLLKEALTKWPLFNELVPRDEISPYLLEARKQTNR